MTSAYPIAHEQLVEKVRAMAEEIGEWPSRRRVMRSCRVGAPRADAALDALRREGFDPSPRRGLSVVPDAAETHADDEQERPAGPIPGAAEGASDETAEAATEGTELDGEALVGTAAGAEQPAHTQRVPRWPLLIIALPAFVAIWSGWVGLGRLTGFGPVTLLPGLADEWVLDTAVTLPIGVEVYAAYALSVWLSGAPVTQRARSFAKWSALGSLALGAAGQVAYHLMSAAGMTVAPWQITAGVACLPVGVLGCAAALVHLQHEGRPA